MHLPPVSFTPLANLVLRISPRIFEKIRNDPYGILRGLGETDSWKKQKSKTSWHFPFKIGFGIPKKIVQSIDKVNLISLLRKKTERDESEYFSDDNYIFNFVIALPLHLNSHLAEL
jgi:hypothetical protein